MRWTMWLYTRFMLVADQLLGTRLIEWELARRQRLIDQLVIEMQDVNRELAVLSADLELCQLAMCLVDLRARSERNDLENWLRFAPHSDGEEALLNKVIECLVKSRLASVDVEPVGLDIYVYHLNPDWPAIVERLREISLGVSLMSWLEEQSRFVAGGEC